MNLPNKLTVLRIILVPVLLVLIYNMGTSFAMSLISVLVFLLISLTDMLDGHIARSRNLVTDFGKFLDPIADKMLTTAALLGFIAKGVGEGITWIVFIVLFREFLIASLRLVAASSNVKKVVAANIWGKLKTVSQMVAIIVALAVCQYKVLCPVSSVLNDVLDIIVNVLLWASAVLCVISGIIYLYDNKDFVDPSK